MIWRRLVSGAVREWDCLVGVVQDMLDRTRDAETERGARLEERARGFATTKVGFETVLQINILRSVEEHMECEKGGLRGRVRLEACSARAVAAARLVGDSGPVYPLKRCVAWTYRRKALMPSFSPRSIHHARVGGHRGADAAAHRGWWTRRSEQGPDDVEANHEMD
ncbi:hypothetical protein FIBSPDRAFT_934661 [Athelia psychrophila]|uniref:Uncharacterized protein n=1 Tax=Athelia psychrophila TaxID=1759441 RepID=A0A166F1E3_9AGAM|nr:hypothetical protein FIBSPDRAFT_934661 [Fibularhizoctonia sp. CBS 109695]